MNSTIAIDTNVFVYAFDVDELVKRPIALSTLGTLRQSSPPPILLWQVACEFLSVLRSWEKAHKVSAPILAANFQDVLTNFSLTMPTSRLFAMSMSVSSRYSLSHWDSLLIAAALDAGATTLYSEDLSHGAMYDTLRVIDPFQSPAAP